MTRQEVIDHRKAVVRTVFTAESRVMPEWRDRFTAAKEMASEEKERFYDEYVAAVATKIISVLKTG